MELNTKKANKEFQRNFKSIGFGFALLLSACAPFSRTGSDVQQSAPSRVEFAWSDYLFLAVPDSTPLAAAAEWSNASSKLRFFVVDKQVFSANIQAIHPVRSFRNANGGFIELDDKNNVPLNSATGKPVDGNIPSREGEIQGVVLLSEDGTATGLPLTCFQSTFPNTKNEQICKNGSGERFLKLVSTSGDSYVYETTKGVRIASAKKQKISAEVLATYKDAKYTASVHVIELAPGVEVWGGKLVGGINYSSFEGCAAAPATSESGVFTATPPAGYTGNEFFVSDALSQASCSLTGKPITHKARCLQYLKGQMVSDGEKNVKIPGKFCTRAETYDLLSENSAVNQEGGFGLFLVVRDGAGGLGLLKTPAQEDSKTK